MMPPENPKDVSIIKDADRWVAIIDSVRFGGFRSEEAAQRSSELFVTALALERRRIAFHPRLKLRDFGLQ